MRNQVLHRVIQCVLGLPDWADGRYPVQRLKEYMALPEKFTFGTGGQRDPSQRTVDPVHLHKPDGAR